MLGPVPDIIGLCSDPCGGPGAGLLEDEGGPCIG